MDRTPSEPVLSAVRFTGFLVVMAPLLAACAPVSCPAVKTEDNFSVTATSTRHPHPLLALCSAESCTRPLNASSPDRGALLASGHPLDLYATSVDRWRIAVSEDKTSNDTTDPKTVEIALYNSSTLLAKRTITPSWRPAPGACSTNNTANTIRITAP